MSIELGAPVAYFVSMRKKQQQALDRRNFLKVAAGGGAAFAASPASMAAQRPRSPQAEGDTAQAAPRIQVTGKPGSDFMVDVFKPLGFEYIAVLPHSSSRGLHESIINYAGNRNPELITCLHEETAVAMAHGYFKIEGKPMAALIYGTVGLQHASMAVYSAFCDRVPVYVMMGNELETPNSRSAQDPAVMARDFTKYDDAPATLGQFAQAAMRCYSVAMTPPMMPVLLSLDNRLQEQRIPDGSRLRVPKLSLNAPPQGDTAAVSDAARLLVNAEFPVLAVERAARTEAGLKYIVELAELLQAGVADTIQRMNFPSRHYLSQDNSVLRNADVVLALEHPLLSHAALKPDAKLISISSFDLFTRSNYWHFGRYQEPDLGIAADAEATLPLLIEQVKRLMTGDRKRVFDARGAKLREAKQKAMERDRQKAASGWNDSPISTARIAAELWEQIKNKDWSLVSRSDGMSGWAWRLWDFNKYYHHIGQSGSVGIGYSNPASVGAALANRKHGRLTINLQNDGDFMFLPGTLWTAAHHKIPMLTIMHNNRAYNQEVMWIARTAAERNRDVSKCRIGTQIDNPPIDYAKLAQSMGWYAEGPIENPKDLGQAIKRALAVVEKGEPALLDVVTQPT
jgi:acetolactate synthase-1/2/3 large subunit